MASDDDSVAAPAGAEIGGQLGDAVGEGIGEALQVTGMLEPDLRLDRERQQPLAALVGGTARRRDVADQPRAVLQQGVGGEGVVVEVVGGDEEHGFAAVGLAEDDGEGAVGLGAALVAAGVPGLTRELGERGGRTVIRATKPGDLDAVEWVDVYGDIEEGWITFFNQLRHRLERHPDSTRRMIVRNVNLAALPELPGEPWHSSRYQRGADVDGTLVVVGVKPDGAGMLLVTTYDLDDDAFAAVERRWDEWAAQLTPGGQTRP